MPTTQLPETKHKAHEIARKIANERPSTRDKEAPEGNVSGGFNQKREEDPGDGRHPDPDETSASDGDGQ